MTTPPLDRIFYLLINIYDYNGYYQFCFNFSTAISSLKNTVAAIWREKKVDPAIWRPKNVVHNGAVRAEMETRNGELARVQRERGKTT